MSTQYLHIRPPGPGASAGPDVDLVFGNGGETGALMRTFDWSRSPLGAVERWPASLRAVTGLVLRNRFPMALWWGPELNSVYNDAYREILGDKHPASIGAPASRVWAEIWHILGPLARGVFEGGRATWNEHLLLPMNRKGFVEETYFTFSYSPVMDDWGGPGGVLVTCQETTQQVQSERQLETLGELGLRSSAEAKTVEQACETAARALAGNDADAPFVLIYLVDEGGSLARLVSAAGFEGFPDTQLPEQVDLSGEEAPRACWPFVEAARTRKAVLVRELPSKVGRLPGGRWGEPPGTAVCIPLRRQDEARPYGFLVSGVSPRRVFDEHYEAFFRLAASHIATAIGNARAFEEERRRAEALSEIDRAKTTFFSNVSHELRTPLTLILGPTEDLLRGDHGPLAGAQRAELERMHRSELRLQKLVNALLDFARIEAGRLRASYEPTELASLTRDVASGFRSAVERAGLALVIDCPPIDEPVHVDRDMWEKIVLNLLSNAFKFTFEGSIEVRMSSLVGAVALRVRDTGIGIPEHELPRLFERFHRVEGARSRTHEGAGIGLALVHELVKLHGGTIDVESRQGEGTSFTVTIPKGTAHLPKERVAKEGSRATTSAIGVAFVEEALRWLPEGAGRPASAESSEEREQPAEARTGGRILLADDNADVRDYLRRILETQWHVEAFEDGERALSAALARPPDLVLTDVMMPRMNGFELLRRLRADERTRSVPVVMLSARAGEESTALGLSTGADDYLVKPFSARELLARVRAHLELGKLRRAVEVEQVRARRRLESALARERQARELAEQAAHFSEMFVGILGHDLRTPLNAIGMGAEVLAQSSESAAVEAGARRISRSVERMGRMIAQLLDFTRIRLGGGLSLQRADVDLEKVCAGAVEELEAAKACRLRLDAKGDLRGAWDPDRLAQMFSNLASNACHHGAPGQSVAVHLDGTRQDAVVLTIANAGHIPAAVLPRIFEPLRRGEKRGASSGLGLGMFISREIAVAHGGSIQIESSEAEDVTRVVVELPRRPPSSAQQGAGLFTEAANGCRETSGGRSDAA